MPVTVFNPLAAVIVHSQVTVDPLTFQMLADEEALLIHSCVRQGTRQEWRRFNRHGKLIAFVRHSPVLTYSVRATALDPTGENLGNYQPGRNVSDRTLEFANGQHTPFGFVGEVDGTIPGKLILLNPSQEPGAGEAMEVAFTIEHAFIDLDLEEAPGGGVEDPGTPPSFTTLPEQVSASLTTAALTALIDAVFFNVHAFAAAPLTLTLFSGEIAASDPVTLGEWTSVDAPGVPTFTRVRNHAAIDFPATAAVRTVTHVQWARNGVVIARLELGGPVVIPGYYGLRVPVHALALQLTWPMPIPHAGNPGPLVFRYLFGAVTLDPLVTTHYIAEADMDIPRSSLVWGGGSAAGGATYVNNVAELTSGELAPVGGWEFSELVVSLAGGIGMFCIVKKYDPPIAVAAGSPLVLSPGEFFLELS